MNRKSTKLQELSTRISARILSAVVLVGFSAARVWAQTPSPSGTVSGSGTGPIYTYDLTFSDGASASGPIGGVWYGWVYPTYDYLPGIPSTVSTPTGWSYTINGPSIEFYTTLTTDYIQKGQTLSGFSYTASFSPATLAADPYAPYSEAYDTGNIGLGADGALFTVTTVVPEPSAAALFGIGALGLAVNRWRRLRVSE